MKKISVIVPIYNVEKYLHRCIDSIINQTYKNIEIILVDDGSPDNCSKICDEYTKKDTRIKVIHKKNGGLSSARNAGIRSASGDYIAFVDSDDWIESNMYERLYELIRRDNYDLALCQYCQNGDRNLNEKFRFNGEVVSERILNKQEIKDDFVEKFITYDVNSIIMGSVCRGLYLKRIIEEKKIYFDENIKFVEDLYFTLEYLRNIDTMIVTNDVLYNYMQNENSILHSYQPKMYEYGKERAEFLKHYFSDIGQFEKNKDNFDYLEFNNLLCSIFNKCYIKNEFSKKEHLHYAKSLTNQNKNIFLNKSLYKKLNLKQKLSFLMLKYNMLIFLVTYYRCKFNTIKTK